MKYTIEKDVFDVLPTVCVGIVAVAGVDNAALQPELSKMLQENIALCEKQLEGVKVKESPDIKPYREAFTALGINPNKYMCSIEALINRIARKKGLPSINPLVDLNNAVSVKYRLPMGTHDLSTMKEDLQVRFAEEGDTFVAFGATEVETPDSHELVYVSGHEVRTRRWTWRQSEVGKITEETSSVFFPIDGFTDVNKDQVLAARDELASLVKKYFGKEPLVGYVDKDCPSFDLTAAAGKALNAAPIESDITFEEDQELHDRLAKVVRRRAAETITAETDEEILAQKLYDAAILYFVESAKPLWPDLDAGAMEQSTLFQDENEQTEWIARVKKLVGKHVINKPEDITYYINKETLMEQEQAR